MEHCRNYCFTSRLGCQITVSKNQSHFGCETVVLTVFRFVLTEHYTVQYRQAEGGMKAQSTQHSVESREQLRAQSTAHRREQRTAQSTAHSTAQLRAERLELTAHSWKATATRQVIEGEERRTLITEKQIR